MVKLPQAGLTSVGFAFMCVTLIASANQSASAANPVPIAKRKTVNTGHSPTDRYDASMIVRGSRREAVNICIAAAQKQGRRFGTPQNTDITQVEQLASGYVVHGSSLIALAKNDQPDLFGFRCATRNGQVSAIRLSPNSRKN
jgi:hypothetical protein